MKAQDQIEQAERALERLAGALAPNPRRQASARRLFLEQAARLRSGAEPVRSTPVRRLSGWQRVAVAFSIAFLALGGLTGVASAAERALPGDLLYPLDRAIEGLRLSATRRPADRAVLLMEFADERLQEAERLASPGNEHRMEVALEAYDQTIENLAREVGSAGGADQRALNEMLVQALSVHEQRLLAVREKAPEAAWPGLDRAIEASHQGQGGNPPSHLLDKTPGPPEDQSDDASQNHPDKTPHPTKDKPRNPPGRRPTKTPGSP